MVKSTKYYDVLGVSPDCDQDTLRKAYYAQARMCHPDKQGSGADAAKAEERFKLVSEAYTCLKDPQKRKEYDLGGESAVDQAEMDPAHAVAQFEELARSLFGGRAFDTIFGDVATLALFKRMMRDVGGNEGKIREKDDKEGREQDAKQDEKEEEERCQELALLLVSSIKFYIRGEVAIFEEMCVIEAEYLYSSPGGAELLEMVALVYVQEAKQYLKRYFGLESFFAEVAEKSRTLSQGFSIARHLAKIAIAQNRMEKKVEKAGKMENEGNGVLAEEARKKAEQETAQVVLEDGLLVSWKLGKTLLEQRIRRVCDIVMGDKSLPSSLRDARSEAVLRRGEIFESVHERLQASEAKAREEPTAALLATMKAQMNTKPQQ